MSDDEDDDLFADSDSGGDTDELIAESKQKAIAKPKKKILKKKGAGNKRKRIPGVLFLSPCDHGIILIWST